MESIKNPAEFADKKFGQNFLQDQRYIDKIIQSMPDGDLPIAEIGPGLGDLTSELVKARNVTAFEIDKRLCEHLRNKFDPQMRSGKLKLICGDAMEHWEQGALINEPYDLVANLPYYLATHFILRALHDPMCQSVLVMVQKEVADKFAAETNQREFSALGVLAQTVGEAKVLFEVPAEAFTPPPKVTSAVLSICKDRSLEDPLFEKFLKVAFAQPRKKLIKNLEKHGDKEKILSAFAKVDLDPMARPHEAETKVYHHLYNILKKDFENGQKPSRTNKRERKQQRTKTA